MTPLATTSASTSRVIEEIRVAATMLQIFTLTYYTQC